jgi:cell division protein ZapA (FtsZ GTPase activity inhibitor)
VHKRTVALHIAGREYRVRSDADEEWLQHVADCVDETMAQIRDRTGMVDSFDIAMLTCLNLAREVIGHRDAQSDSTLVDEDRLKHLTDTAESALAELPADLHLVADGGDGLLPLGELSSGDAAQGILGSIGS